MIRFDEFTIAAPRLAEPIGAKLAATGIGMLGTIRKDGSPRISPIETSFQDGRLYVGMMPGSMKARDLLRDPRFVLVTPVADKDDLGGEGKLFGSAREITDPDEMAARLGHAVAELGMELEDFAGTHMFELLVEAAAWQKVDGDEWVTVSWKQGGSIRERRRVGASGGVVDVPTA